MNIFKTATINIANVELTGYQEEASKLYYLSLNQLRKPFKILSDNRTGKTHLRPLLEASLGSVHYSVKTDVSANTTLVSVELVKKIVKVYARLGNQKCWDFLEALADESIDRRFDLAFGVERSEAERNQKLIELMCNKTPKPWELRFSQEFYGHLSRLTNLEAHGHKRPVRWAALTNQLIYSQLPTGLQQKLVQLREEDGGAQKLHQFLTDNGGVPAFNDQMTMVLILMRSTSSVEELLKAIATNKFGHHQKSLPLS